MLKVVATLIRQSKQTESLIEVKKLFLSDMTLLCNSNRENRRTVLQMSVWQEWLIAMAYIHPKNTEEQKISDMVYSLFRMLLHHAIKYEYGGWRVWVDTLAIVHSKVSYEEFKLQFAQMYEHYERQRTDNITDPALRQARPISTISGWEREELQQQQHGTVHNATSVTSLEDVPQVDEDGEDEVETEDGLTHNQENEVDDVDVETERNEAEGKCDCAIESSLCDKSSDPPKEDIANETIKSSISSVSEVYNEHIKSEIIVTPVSCNGNVPSSVNTCETASPTKIRPSSAQEALKETLNISELEELEIENANVDSTDNNVHIELVLKNSEKSLADCKVLADELQEASSVIKDEEIELAVNEVVQGVLNNEKKQLKEPSVEHVPTSVDVNGPHLKVTQHNSKHLINNNVTESVTDKMSTELNANAEIINEIPDNSDEFRNTEKAHAIEENKLNNNDIEATADETSSKTTNTIQGIQKDLVELEVSSSLSTTVETTEEISSLSPETTVSSTSILDESLVNTNESPAEIAAVKDIVDGLIDKVIEISAHEQQLEENLQNNNNTKNVNNKKEDKQSGKRSSAEDLLPEEFLSETAKEIVEDVIQSAFEKAISLDSSNERNVQEKEQQNGNSSESNENVADFVQTVVNDLVEQTVATIVDATDDNVFEEHEPDLLESEDKNASKAEIQDFISQANDGPQILNEVSTHTGCVESEAVISQETQTNQSIEETEEQVSAQAPHHQHQLKQQSASTQVENQHFGKYTYDSLLLLFHLQAQQKILIYTVLSRVLKCFLFFIFY